MFLNSEPCRLRDLRACGGGGVGGGRVYLRRFLSRRGVEDKAPRMESGKRSIAMDSTNGEHQDLKRLSQTA